MGYISVLAVRRYGNAVKGDSFEYFLSPIWGLNKNNRNAGSTVHDSLFLSRSKYFCSSVDQEHLLDLLTGAMKRIQHYIAVNAITLYLWPLSSCT